MECMWERRERVRESEWNPFQIWTLEKVRSTEPLPLTYEECSTHSKPQEHLCSVQVRGGTSTVEITCFCLQLINTVLTIWTFQVDILVCGFYAAPLLFFLFFTVLHLLLERKSSDNLLYSHRRFIFFILGGCQKRVWRMSTWTNILTYSPSGYFQETAA